MQTPAPTPTAFDVGKGLGIAGFLLALANTAFGVFIYRRRQGRLKVKASWQRPQGSPEPELHVVVTLKAGSEPVIVEKVALHLTSRRHWRDRGSFITNTAGGTVLPAALQATASLVAKVGRAQIWTERAKPFLSKLTVKQAMETPTPENIRTFKFRAWAYRGDGKQFRSHRIELAPRGD